MSLSTNPLNNPETIIPIVKINPTPMETSKFSASPVGKSLGTLCRRLQFLALAKQLFQKKLQVLSLLH